MCSLSVALVCFCFWYNYTGAVVCLSVNGRMLWSEAAHYLWTLLEDFESFSKVRGSFSYKD
jgi:hypothetical protein